MTSLRGVHDAYATYIAGHAATAHAQLLQHGVILSSDRVELSLSLPSSLPVGPEARIAVNAVVTAHEPLQARAPDLWPTRIDMQLAYWRIQRETTMLNIIHIYTAPEARRCGLSAALCVVVNSIQDSFGIPMARAKTVVVGSWKILVTHGYTGAGQIVKRKPHGA